MTSQDIGNVSAVVRANNIFAFSLFKELCKTEGDKNLFFSPLSITAALAMIHLGAGGDSAQEIKTALNVCILERFFSYSQYAGVPEAFQGGRGKSRIRGIQGGRSELRERGSSLCFVIVFIC